MFAEAEDDVEFEHRDGACLLTDEQDIVDSDFDENSSEEGSEDDDEAEEQVVHEERQERRQQKVARTRAVPMHVMRSGGAPAPALRHCASHASAQRASWPPFVAAAPDAPRARPALQPRHHPRCLLPSCSRQSPSRRCPVRLSASTHRRDAQTRRRPPLRQTLRRPRLHSARAARACWSAPTHRLPALGRRARPPISESSALMGI